MPTLILITAAFLGGASNALAGGGTFLVFPALLWAGVAPVKANAMCSLVLLPGVFTSTWVYRDWVRKVEPPLLLRMSAASLVGSAIGAVLLMTTSNATFSDLVPWLLLLAATVFTASPKLREVAERSRAGESTAALLIGQTIISIYGGYFGAGMGVLMVGLYLIASQLDLSASTGLRMICTSVVNTLAVAIFAWRGALDYTVGMPMLVAGVAGGFLGAKAVKRLDSRHARLAILIYAWGLTAWFFVRKFISLWK